MSLAVNTVEVSARFTGLLRAAIGKNTIAVARPVKSLRFAAWQEPGAFNIRVGTSLDLIKGKERNEAYKLVVVTRPTIILLVIVQPILGNGRSDGSSVHCHIQRFGYGRLDDRAAPLHGGEADALFEH